ncbi:hypothetical protein KCU88_g3868, partial [Aureobasidium melanogenum]
MFISSDPATKAPNETDTDNEDSVQTRDPPADAYSGSGRFEDNRHSIPKQPYWHTMPSAWLEEDYDPISPGHMRRASVQIKQEEVEEDEARDTQRVLGHREEDLRAGQYLDRQPGAVGIFGTNYTHERNSAGQTSIRHSDYVPNDPPPMAPPSATCRIGNSDVDDLFEDGEPGRLASEEEATAREEPESLYTQSAFIPVTPHLPHERPQSGDQFQSLFRQSSLASGTNVGASPETQQRTTVEQSPDYSEFGTELGYKAEDGGLDSISPSEPQMSWFRDGGFRSTLRQVQPELSREQHSYAQDKVRVLSSAADPPGSSTTEVQTDSQKCSCGCGFIKGHCFCNPLYCKCDGSARTMGPPAHAARAWHNRLSENNQRDTCGCGSGDQKCCCFPGLCSCAGCEEHDNTEKPGQERPKGTDPKKLFDFSGEYYASKDPGSDSEVLSLENGTLDVQETHVWHTTGDRSKRSEAEMPERNTSTQGETCETSNMLQPAEEEHERSNTESVERLTAPKAHPSGVEALRQGNISTPDCPCSNGAPCTCSPDFCGCGTEVSGGPAAASDRANTTARSPDADAAYLERATLLEKAILKGYEESPKNKLIRLLEKLDGASSLDGSTKALPTYARRLDNSGEQSTAARLSLLPPTQFHQASDYYAHLESVAAQGNLSLHLRRREIDNDLSSAGQSRSRTTVISIYPTSQNLVTRPDTPRPAPESGTSTPYPSQLVQDYVRQSVEPECLPATWEVRSMTGYDDRSDTPSPRSMLSRQGLGLDLEMQDVSNGLEHVQSRQEREVSVPPSMLQHAPDTASRRSQSPGKPSIPPIPGGSGSPLKQPKRDDRRKSGVHGAKVNKRSVTTTATSAKASPSKPKISNVTRKVTTARQPTTSLGKLVDQARLDKAAAVLQDDRPGDSGLGKPDVGVSKVTAAIEKIEQQVRDQQEIVRVQKDGTPVRRSRRANKGVRTSLG